MLVTIRTAIEIIARYEHELLIDPHGDGALDYLQSLPEHQRQLLDRYLNEKIRQFAPAST